MSFITEREQGAMRISAILASARVSFARAPTTVRLSLATTAVVAVVVMSVVHAPAWVDQPGPFGVGIDKWIHFGSYAMITVALAYVGFARRVSVLLAIVLATVLLGAGVEVIQSTIPWRSMEMADIVANTAGAVVAFGLWYGSTGGGRSPGDS